MIYRPGLAGGFLFDDVPNLEGLAYLGSPLQWSEVGEFVFSNHAGITGRPLAMLSFALQASSWPAHPGAFKAVNLGLHLCNTLLVAVLFCRIAALQGSEPRGAIWLGLAVAALWSLHPMQVSTVLYVIQRMVLLATLFFLLALLGYVWGRCKLGGSPGMGWAAMGLSLAVGGGLSVLSKEIGVLIPLLALVLERALTFPPLPRLQQRLIYGLLALPVAGMVFYMFLQLPSWWSGVATQRDFTLGERLLTEPRVLLDYFRAFLMPGPARLGLFQDGYLVSRSLSEPGSTPVALLLVAVAGVFAWLRTSSPFALGIAWFLACHLLEATVVPLELYFEHRNYLALAGLAYVLMVGAIRLARRWPDIGRWSVIALALWGLGCSWLSWNEARLWGNPVQQAATWAREHPDSARAQWHWAGLLGVLDKPKDQAEVYEQMTERFPSHRPALLVARLILACGDAGIGAPSPSQVRSALQHASLELALFEQLTHLLLEVEEGRCRFGGEEVVLSYLDSLERNPAYASKHHPLTMLKSRFMAAFGNFPGAAGAARQAFFMAPTFESALFWLKAAQRAGDAGQITEACTQGRQLPGVLPSPGRQALSLSCASLGVAQGK